MLCSAGHLVHVINLYRVLNMLHWTFNYHYKLVRVVVVGQSKNIKTLEGVLCGCTQRLRSIADTCTTDKAQSQIPVFALPRYMSSHVALLGPFVFLPRFLQSGWLDSFVCPRKDLK